MRRRTLAVALAIVVAIGAIALARADKRAAKPQTTCPVSDKKLGEGGDMGPPVTLAYKGRTVKGCCKMCIGKLEKDPATYLAKLPGEQPPAK